MVTATPDDATGTSSYERDPNLEIPRHDPGLEKQRDPGLMLTLVVAVLGAFAAFAYCGGVSP